MHGKVKLTERITNLQKRIELTENKVPALQPTPMYILSMRSVVWNISIGQLELATWLCSLPALVHLLISQSWETEKSP